MNDPRRYFEFFCPSNGPSDLVAQRYATNIFFNARPPLRPDGTAVLEARIRTGDRVAHVDPKGAKKPEDMSEVVWAIASGSWQEEGYPARELWSSKTNERLVPGYEVLMSTSLQQELLPAKPFVLLKISPLMLDVDDNSIHYDQECGTFFQLIHDEFGNVTGGYLGYCYGRKRSNILNKQVMTASGIGLYKLDQNLMNAVLLAAEMFFREGAVNPVMDYRLKLCWSLRQLDELYAKAGLDQQSIDTLSFGRYSAVADTALFAPKEETRREKAEFIEQMSESDHFMVRCEKAVLAGRGLADQFHVVDTIMGQLNTELGTRLEATKLGEFTKSASLVVREAIIVLTEHAFYRPPMQAALESHVGFPRYAEPDDNNNE